MSEDESNTNGLERLTARRSTFTVLDKGKPVVRRGRKAMGSYPSEGGRFKAARLPKGWTGPVSKSGLPGPPQGGPGLFLRPTFSPLPSPHQAHQPVHLLLAADQQRRALVQAGGDDVQD